MVYCCASNCCNRTGNGKFFFQLPSPRKNLRLHQIWLSKIKRSNLKVTEYTSLCSDHFEDSCFIYNSLLVPNGDFSQKQVKLKSNAVPTIFNHSRKLLRKKKKYRYFENHLYSEEMLTFEDVSVIFSKEEWQILQKSEKELYRNVMTDNYKLMISVGFKIPKLKLIALLEDNEELVFYDFATTEVSGNLLKLPGGTQNTSSPEVIHQPVLLSEVQEHASSCKAFSTKLYEDQKVPETTPKSAISDPNPVISLLEDDQELDSGEASVKEDFGGREVASSPKTSSADSSIAQHPIMSLLEDNEEHTYEAVKKEETGHPELNQKEDVTSTVTTSLDSVPLSCCLQHEVPTAEDDHLLRNDRVHLNEDGIEQFLSDLHNGVLAAMHDILATCT
ncbi:zinc finger imprinted 2-like [Protopterus annectens]|uniref:zinc finger imprinted 2-like n=1 Tax=Protopterus annectens TaxID=7888 RepID=UPI001CFA3AC3|nr:zinc finger imprinted 2-like [Protopterus annectens]